MPQYWQTVPLRRAPAPDHPGGGADLPEWLQRSLYLALVGSALISVVYVGEFSPLPMTLILDIWVLVLAGWILLRGRIIAHLTLVVVGVYIGTRLIGAYLNAPPIEDFLQAYRWLVYLVVFALARGHRWNRTDLLSRLAWWLIGLATLKSILTAVFVGPDERPGLFLENNFELALFTALAAVVQRRKTPHAVWLVILLGLLTVLSGSRSGALTYLVLVTYTLWTSRSSDIFIRYLGALTPVIAVAIPWFIFQDRAGESQVIDRVRFFEVFQTETAGWHWLQWLSGTPPITPLSSNACEELSYYEELFSSAGDGQCYSVILHSFVMRLIYDGGYVALAIAFIFPLVIMRMSHVRWSLTLALLAIAIINSLSVSGLNNPYVALPILFAVLTATGLEKPAGTPDASKRSPHQPFVPLEGAFR